METKERLITIAGELFADLGFDAVSTRMITDKAGVKLSAIHYHFGTKENLYIECCVYAHSTGRKLTFGDVMTAEPSLLESPEGQATIIEKIVVESMHYHFEPSRPEWETKIIQREITHPTAAMRTLSEKIFKPDTKSAQDFYMIVRPEATEQEAQAWSDLMYGQMLLYKMAKQTIEMVRGENALDQEFLSTAAQTLARAMILEAGLPLPEKLIK